MGRFGGVSESLLENDLEVDGLDGEPEGGRMGGSDVGADHAQRFAREGRGTWVDGSTNESVPGSAEPESGILLGAGNTNRRSDMIRAHEDIRERVLQELKGYHQALTLGQYGDLPEVIAASSLMQDTECRLIPSGVVEATRGNLEWLRVCAVQGRRKEGLEAVERTRQLWRDVPWLTTMS